MEAGDLDTVGGCWYLSLFFFFLFLEMQLSVGLVLLAPILESGKLLLLSFSM